MRNTGIWEYLWWVLQMKRIYDYEDMNEYLYWLLLKYLLTTAEYSSGGTLVIPDYRQTPAVKIAEDCMEKLQDDWRSSIRNITLSGNGYVASETFRREATFALKQLEHVHLIQNEGFGGYVLNPKWFGKGIHWDEVTAIKQETEYKSDGMYARVYITAKDSEGTENRYELDLEPKDINERG